MITTATERSELAHRSADGIDVSLYWTKLTDHVTIELTDRRLGDRLEFEVNRDKALDAFRHPFAYAPAQALDPLVQSREPVRHEGPDSETARRWEATR